MRRFVTSITIGFLLMTIGTLARAVDPLETELSGCASPYCDIQLACETEYTFDGSPSDTETLITSFSYPIRVNGCGDSTVIKYDASYSSGIHGALFQITNSVTGGITFSNMKFTHKENNASTTLARTFLIFANDVTFDNVTFESTAPDADSVIESILTYNGIKRLTVRNSRFTTAGNAIGMADCDQCEVSGSRFKFNFYNGWSAENVGSVIKGEGDGVRIINNTFDLFSTADVNYYGVKLFTDSDLLNNHTQVIGNTFTGFPPYADVRGIEIYKYGHALISGNTFIAGNRCSETTETLCDDNEDCDGEETCEPPAADGIAFVSASANKHNSFNIITGNMFNKFKTSNDACPVDFTSGSGNGTTQAVYNHITNNHFGAEAATFPAIAGANDGVCSLPGSTNILANNLTH